MNLTTVSIVIVVFGFILITPVRVCESGVNMWCVCVNMWWCAEAAEQGDGEDSVRVMVDDS